MISLNLKNYLPLKNILTQRYDGTLKEEILTKVVQEFYEEEKQAEVIKMQVLDLDNLEVGRNTNLD